MDNEKFRGKYRIASARAKWHHYSGGAYFITVCTKRREHFFGQIANEEMKLTSVGSYLSDNLEQISEHYPYADVPVFVVMPNHWHAIVFIDSEKTPYLRNGEPLGSPTAPNAAAKPETTSEMPSKNKQMQDIANKKGWLSVAIGGVKSAVTKFANEQQISFGWQTRFHDHIIRNEEELHQIAVYIENNVINWDKDCFNKKNKPK